MSEENLTSNISQLSLDQNANTGIQMKKNRRPNRAYHNMATVVPPNAFATPPMPTPPEFGMADSQNMNSPNNRVFTPKAFNSPVSSATKDNFGHVRHASVASPIQNTSHLVPTQRWEDQLNYLQKGFETATDSVPPLSTTQFYCADQGTCDPRLMSLSMYNVPRDELMRAATKLPLGVTVQPFATIVPTAPVPVVEIESDHGPLRCRRCRAYANPKFQFTYDSHAVCNICKVKMPIPSEHFAPMGIDGRRSDIATKPELHRGSVDFKVPPLYNAVKEVEPMPLHYVFLIDVSVLANENGSSLAAIDSVRSSIDFIADNQPNCKVAIIAYDNKLKFYNLRPDAETTQEYIVSELDDVFLPFYNGMFVKPDDAINVIYDTLRKIENFVNMDKYSHVAYSCFGSALQAAKLALDTITKGNGGKIICTLNALPNCGNGILVNKRDDATRKNLKCDSDFYNKIAYDLLKSNISVDTYVTNAGYIDMATTTFPSQVTSGLVNYYPHFRHGVDDGRIINDMIQNISNIVGYQGVFKVRSSNGISPFEYYLESADGITRDPLVSCLTKNTIIDVLFKYDEKLKSGDDVHFQAALLYTDIDGVRKVRCLNASGAVSDSVREVFKFINQNAVARIMIKDVIETLGDCNFAETRRIIDSKMSDILTQYRALVSGSSSTQLVLPDTLKTLPVYMLSFQKSELMRPNHQSSRGNDRVFDKLKYSQFNSAQLSYKLYPQIIPTHVLLESHDLTFFDENDQLIQIGQDSVENLSVRAGYSHFQDGGAYLIFNGEVVYLWFNEHTNRMLLQDLLSVDPSIELNQISLFSGSLPEADTDINRKVSNVLQYWRQITNRNYIPLVLLRPNIDQYYSSVISHIFVEDQSMSKIEAADNYLVTLHRRIQDNLKKQNFIKAGK
ncbi:hypothetical protein TBLA_0H01690 [Henningerozyma blattae CBS 6284]|uniref:SED5-binding protein 3 n=1 Tax=Henningerozyma blattae (strain ATCC 34711 / CBS 6284 / DSM 70876 / NBRC 10599 / NRRL Y-10934 / UCD 77-7) TaxID=1071380 RepID=I2H7V4_HENB6|nr:hypothetical protein TBLA_0H01690 [Tetrapisispora blattae CBS 6284]CCH62456.1 hypothetical protein TBLA_0H01690 [Tetrapisispora blattae CBS 6284]